MFQIQHKLIVSVNDQFHNSDSETAAKVFDFGAAAARADNLIDSSTLRNHSPINDSVKINCVIKSTDVRGVSDFSISAGDVSLSDETVCLSEKHLPAVSSPNFHVRQSQRRAAELCGDAADSGEWDGVSGFKSFDDTGRSNSNSMGDCDVTAPDTGRVVCANFDVPRVSVDRNVP